MIEPSATPASNPAVAAAPETRPKEDPAKVRDASRQFEALLLGQMLRSVRESGGGWLGSGEDEAGSCAVEMAEQQFARLLAEQGGLGLATLVSAGLERKSPSSD